MAKKRKTRDQKVKSSKRVDEQLAFRIKEGWIAKNDGSSKTSVLLSGNELKYFRTDLTKTLFLTMLVLAVELALWQILSRH